MHDGQNEYLIHSIKILFAQVPWFNCLRRHSSSFLKRSEVPGDFTLAWTLEMSGHNSEQNHYWALYIHYLFWLGQPRGRGEL